MLCRQAPIKLVVKLSWRIRSLFNLLFILFCDPMGMGEEEAPIPDPTQHHHCTVVYTPVQSIVSIVYTAVMRNIIDTAES